tara:strand:- start:2091 stop:2219 length:129 start_codon:yes stop_codon:yes gene_type:complete
VKENKVSFIKGITDQDGTYLAEFLLARGYEAKKRIFTKKEWV